ncbi:uncharacterized protein [Dysidea avara]|uniref:uncharacterized protein n=1 Tax=Dysidea avara TaxID=196820 RepID=UPI00333269CF
MLYNEHFRFLEDHKSYCVGGIVLGQSLVFNGSTFDHFDKPAEPTQFNVECIDCLDNFRLYGNRFLVDNTTSLSIKFSGEDIENYTNITLHLTSILYYYRQIKVTLVVELVPCLGHPGFVYSKVSKECSCYDHDVVKCTNEYGEIKRGYWFGTVNKVVTTTLCPSQYCNFIKHQETTKDYFRLSKNINDQCKLHRLGSACGECSPRYTLAYDSTDCISVDHCGTGMTVLVVVLTCLYWIVVVVGVFSLMYFNFQISSGYVYGIIYYYSMVDILLSINPYISDGAFQFINILSSFAQLTPRFLGQLCLVEGMSGIDQLFIHYCHAVAVSLLLLVFVFAARYSPRVSLFISRCILRVICLLLLLSYTSLASTSLQLLRPLIFTDINKVYTYSSPHVQYFHGRHMFYGIVAVLCELVVGIGLPLFLLLEPSLSRKINFVKIKPLLDQLQGCYKDKYRWFAAYYLICRQVIVLVMYIFNKDYHNLLFYLQTTCTVIAFIHIWIQPYKNDLLNALDGVILLIMISLINIATFTFLQPMVTEITLVLVIFPLLFYCLIMIRRAVLNCMFWKRFQRYHSLSSAEDSSDVEETIRSNQEPVASKSYYSTFQESLLSLSANHD